MMRKGRKTQEVPENTGPSVSELLKITRERSGSDLQTVAEVLRIRLVYLEAIEDNRYNDLPGKTYVVGFVRAYAEHLGLDSDEVVKRFKDEIDGLEGKAELVFPSPVTEQSVPGGAIVLIGLIILGAAYGGWYFLSSQDRSMAELVPDLPAKFAEMVEKVKGAKEDKAEPEMKQEEAEETAETAKPVEQVSEADTQDMAQKALEAVEKAEQKAEEVVQTVETVKVEEAAPAEEIEKTEEVIEEKVEEAAQEVAAVEPALEEKKEEVVEKIEEAVQETETPAVTEVAEKVEEVTTETAVETAEEVTEEATEEVATAASEFDAVPEPVVEEEPAKPVVMTEKIVLKGVDHAWTQVTDENGNVIHTQTLVDGDEYEVPQKHGLILRTGNAGGLEIYVDGVKMPSIGEIGDVLRKVYLNPTKLKDGSAVES